LRICHLSSHRLGSGPSCRRLSA